MIPKSPTNLFWAKSNYILMVTTNPTKLTITNKQTSNIYDNLKQRRSDLTTLSRGPQAGCTGGTRRRWQSAEDKKTATTTTGKEEKAAWTVMKAASGSAYHYLVVWSTVKIP
jgi:hypothetical protein